MYSVQGRELTALLFAMKTASRGRVTTLAEIGEQLSLMFAKAGSFQLKRGERNSASRFSVCHDVNPDNDDGS